MNTERSTASGLSRRLLDAVPDTLLLLDEELRLLTWHAPEANATDALGLGCSPQAGLSLSELLPDNIADFAAEIAQLCLSTGTPQVADFGGSGERHFSLRLLPRDEGLLMVISDISDRKRMELSLARARQQAQAADRAKTAFLAHMSHDLRTPITTVIGMLEILRSAELDRYQHDAVELAYSGARDQLRLLDDILDISRMEAGAIEITAAPTDLADTVTTVVETLRYQAESKGLRLEFATREQLPTVACDPARLRQILYNLISNAIKYTERGGVTVGVQAVAQPPDEVDFRISVSDTGRGIPASRLATLFQPFTRDEENETKAAGHGLGLTICQSLARAMCGHLTVDSAPDSGSTFSLHFTARACSEAPTGTAEEATATAVPALRGLRVLVAEDDPGLQRMMRYLLESLEVSVEQVSDGQAALERARDGDFDCILMDYSMPRLDGVSATTRIRELAGAAAATPIVALTAHADRETREHCLAQGMNDFLAKPFTRSALVSALQRCRDGSGTAVERDADRGVTAQRPPPAATSDDLDQQALADTLALAGDGAEGQRFLTGLISDLRDWGPELLAELDEASAADDHETVARLAHRAKSRTRMLGLARCAELFASMEHDAEARAATRELVAAAHTQLRAGLARLEAWAHRHLSQIHTEGESP